MDLLKDSVPWDENSSKTDELLSEVKYLVDRDTITIAKGSSHYAVFGLQSGNHYGKSSGKIDPKLAEQIIAEWKARNDPTPLGLAKAITRLSNR